MVVRPLNTFSPAKKKDHCLLQPKCDHATKARLSLHHRNLKIIPLKEDHSESPIFVFNDIPYLTSFSSLRHSESYVLSRYLVFKLGNWVSLTPSISILLENFHSLASMSLWSRSTLLFMSLVLVSSIERIPLNQSAIWKMGGVHWSKWKHTLRLREAFSEDHAISE